ncbi:UNVERIFIED_CONTAM: hypothetical protein Slati_0909400 [Sesamum latifolium]|uniref:Uncharacterized protein n=1 Tax=Sesamum latifolium TaxID=2727402 RepID=A0AAW2XRZ7_9LAMI
MAPSKTVSQTPYEIWHASLRPTSTKDMFLIYDGGELILKGYSNASIKSHDDDAKS